MECMKPLIREFVWLQGDVIGLLHSDDFFYDNGVISRIVEHMKTTRADFLYGDGLFVNPDNTDKVVRNWIGGDYRLWKVRHGWLPLHPTCYIRREVMMRLGLYNEVIRLLRIVNCWCVI